LNLFRTAIERGTVAASVRDMKRRIAGGEIATMMGTADIDDEAGLSSPEEIPPQEPPQIFKDSVSLLNLTLRGRKDNRSKYAENAWG
jgi:hypothetical protein